MRKEGPSVSNGGPVLRDNDDGLPNGMMLIGAVVNALKLTRDLPLDVKCNLADRTSRRGFKGMCKTRFWCCRLTALCQSLIHHELVRIPPILGDDAESHRLALFTMLAPQLIMWEQLRASDGRVSELALLRHAAATEAIRVGFLLSAMPEAHPAMSSLMSTSPAWADSDRRIEPLRKLYDRAGCKIQKAFAEALGYTEDTITEWFHHGKRPSTAALTDIATYFATAIPEAQQADVTRTLRWHYALSTLVDDLKRRFGPDSVNEIVAVCVGVATCVARRFRADPDPTIPARAAQAALHMAQKVDDAEGVIAHAARHGASAGFVDDVIAAHHLWRRIMPPDAGNEAPLELELLVRHLPRRP